MPQGFGAGGLCLVLSASRRLVALGINQEIVFVRLHAYASVELSCYRKACEVLRIDLTPTGRSGQRSTAQVCGQPRLPERASISQAAGSYLSSWKRRFLSSTSLISCKTADLMTSRS